MKKSNVVKVEDIENAPGGVLQCDFSDKIDGIETEGNITSKVTMRSLGDLIKINGHVEGTVILECDLCLDKYKYKLDFNMEEFFAKNTMLEEYGAETELKEGQFIEDLGGKKEIDISDILYQSVILNFPNKK